MDDISLKIKKLSIAVSELEKQNKLLDKLQRTLTDHNKLLTALDRKINYTTTKHGSKLSKLNSDINDLYSRLSNYK